MHAKECDDGGRRLQALLAGLREALEASWGEDTSYGGVKRAGNPARGQCYPTARVVQHLLPGAQVIEGQVWNGNESEAHFWNALVVDGGTQHIDLTWQQFPPGSYVQEQAVLRSDPSEDSDATRRRCALLLERVVASLDRARSQPAAPR